MSIYLPAGLARFYRQDLLIARSFFAAATNWGEVYLNVRRPNRWIGRYALFGNNSLDKSAFIGLFVPICLKFDAVLRQTVRSENALYCR